MSVEKGIFFWLLNQCMRKREGEFLTVWGLKSTYLGSQEGSYWHPSIYEEISMVTFSQ